MPGRAISPARWGAGLPAGGQPGGEAEGALLQADAERWEGRAILVAGELVDGHDLTGRVVDRDDGQPRVAHDETEPRRGVALIVARYEDRGRAVAVVRDDGRSRERRRQCLAVGRIEVADLAVLPQQH